MPAAPHVHNFRTLQSIAFGATRQIFVVPLLVHAVSDRLPYAKQCEKCFRRFEITTPSELTDTHMFDTGDTPQNTVHLATVAKATSIVALAATLCMSASVPAFAKTVADYNAEIAEQEAIVEEKQEAEQKAKDILAEATTWYYKNINADTFNEIVTGRKSVGETIDQISYMDTLYQSYAQKAATAEAAKNEALEAQEVLEALKNEKTARARSLANARSVQFAQSGMSEWSGLRYWSGNVATSGCGLCSYTVIIDVLCGKDYTPADMLSIRGDWRGMDGYPDDDTGTKYGSHHDFTLGEFDIETWNITPTVSELKSALKEKETAAMVCSRGYAFKNRSGAWRWSSGHFVAVLGYDDEGFHVSDSAYPKAEGANVIYSDSEMEKMLANANLVTVYSN